ncbi:MAG: Lpg1974 family pore-forming outer membrane protein [Gemmataceae bacterium]
MHAASLNESRRSFRFYRKEVRTMRARSLLLFLTACACWLIVSAAIRAEHQETPAPLLHATLPHPVVTPGWDEVGHEFHAACAVQDRNGPLLAGDPLLDPPVGGKLGWFSAVQVGLLAPRFKNQLINFVPLEPGFLVTVATPGAELAWTSSPQVEVGYRFAQGCGEVLLTYRSLVSEGHQTIPLYDFFGPGSLRSRLNANIIDLDYGSREWALGPAWDMHWRIGVRLADIFYDSRAQGALRGERVANHYFGVGPHVGLELGYRCCPRWGLTWFSRFEGAVLVGRIGQEFEATFWHFDTPLLGGATSQHGTMTAEVLRLLSGLRWSPACTPLVHFSAGYELEQWWTLGKLEDSRGELFTQGLFLRVELGF